MASANTMRFVPSPIPLRYNYIFSATANPSGRMQYHRIKPGENKQRISRTQFIDAFNSQNIIAIRPLPLENAEVFQLEFYV